MNIIDRDRVAKAKADIIHVFEQIKILVVEKKEAFLSDPKSAPALKYLLIEAVEAITDICQHLLAKARGIPCEGYVDCIMKTGKEGIISMSLANNLRLLANLRNSLIHRYWIINDEQIYDMTVENKGDLLEFVNQVDAFLKECY